MKVTRKRKVLEGHQITQDSVTDAQSWPKWLIDAYADGKVDVHDCGQLVVETAYQYRELVSWDGWVVRSRDGRLHVLTAPQFAKDYSVFVPNSTPAD